MLSYHQVQRVVETTSTLNPNSTITYSQEYTEFLGRWVDSVKIPQKSDLHRVKKKAQWKRSPLSCVKQK